MIKTKSIYANAEESDGKRILITRWYPRGVKKCKYDEWIRDLSPSADLLKKYKDGKIEWDEFIQLLEKEFKENEKFPAIIDRLRQLSINETITLLCYEPSGSNCHRHMVKNIISH